MKVFPIKTIIRSSRNDYTFYPTIPHHHENNNDYTPSQAKELAEKQTKNPDFTRTFRKKLYICGAFAKQQCRL